MFTDRFIKVPIKVYDSKYKDMTDKEVLEDCWMKILPFEISHYKPTYNDDDTETENKEFTCTYCTMKNGEGFYIYLTTDEFEKLINDFDNKK